MHKMNENEVWHVYDATSCLSWSKRIRAKKHGVISRCAIILPSGVPKYLCHWPRIIDLFWRKLLLSNTLLRSSVANHTRRSQGQRANNNSEVRTFTQSEVAYIRDICGLCVPLLMRTWRPFGRPNPWPMQCCEPLSIVTGSHTEAGVMTRRQWMARGDI